MPDLLDRYPLTTGTYHELLDDNGAVRPHWRRLFDQLQRSTPAHLIQRQALLARQIQENGVTYNVYADPKGADRPWELDLLPHVIDPQEWKHLSAGIAQRARLLNAVLADLYGPQRLISEGLLPAELVFGHNNFLWPCQALPHRMAASCTCMRWIWRARPMADGGSRRIGPRRLRGPVMRWKIA